MPQSTHRFVDVLMHVALQHHLQRVLSIVGCGCREGATEDEQFCRGRGRISDATSHVRLAGFVLAELGVEVLPSGPRQGATSATVGEVRGRR